VGGAFVGLGALLWWRGHPIAMAIAGVLGIMLLLGGLLIPGSLGPVYRAWMGLALSKVTTPIFLGVVYFVVFMPVGMVRRALGHRALDRTAVAGSFWLPREEPRRSDLKRQF
jgi:hypothetical protein